MAHQRKSPDWYHLGFVRYLCIITCFILSLLCFVGLQCPSSMCPCGRVFVLRLEMGSNEVRWLKGFLLPSESSACIFGMVSKIWKYHAYFTTVNKWKRQDLTKKTGESYVWRPLTLVHFQVWWAVAVDVCISFTWSMWHWIIFLHGTYEESLSKPS